MRYILLLLFTLLYPFSKGFAQEYSAFSITGRAGVGTTLATDYHSIGINPANLGHRNSFRDPRVTVGTLDHNVTIFAENLSRKELKQAIFRSKNTNFTIQEKKDAAEKMTNSQFSLDANVLLFGISGSHPIWGGLAFSIRDQIRFRSRINSQAAEILFLGQNASYFPTLLLNDGSEIANTSDVSDQDRERAIYGFFPDTTQASNYGTIMDGGRVSLWWTREYNISYGNKLFESYNLTVTGGVGMRLINGIALIDLAAQNGRLTRSNISMSSTFGLDFGDPNDTVSVNNPTFQGFRNSSNFTKLMGADPVGRGYGFDFGLKFIIKKKFNFGISLINVGSLNWQGNVYKINNGTLAGIAGGGLNNYNIFRSSSSTFQFAGTQSPFRWVGSNEIRLELPTTLRIGGSYNHNNRLMVGVDYVMPQNNAPGSLEKNLFAAGVEWRITKVFTISSGVSRGGDQSEHFSIPLGLYYNSMRNLYQMGIASRDFLSYITNIGAGSTISYTAGFIRLKF